MTAVPAKRKNSRRNSSPKQSAERESRAVEPREEAAAQQARSWSSWTTLGLGLGGSLLLWGAFPPLAWWPLAWVAPLPWVLLIRMQELPGRRPYLMLWLAGIAHWLAMMYWIPLCHWAAYFGWFALAMYLGAYLPVFVVLSRIAVHRVRLSPVLVAPVVWIGLELARGYFLTGFSMALLGHALVGQPVLIQIADMFGAYGVSFAVMCVAACLACMLPIREPRWSLWPVAPLVAVIGFVLLYGWLRLGFEPSNDAHDRAARVALIQGSMDTIFDMTEEEAIRHRKKKEEQYTSLTHQARHTYQDLDLIIWPESAFLEKDLLDQPSVTTENGESVDWDTYFRFVTRLAKGTDEDDQQGPNLDTPMLVGTQSINRASGAFQLFNSALLIDGDGQVAMRYHKMHRVVFGEYVPLGDSFPWIYRFTPLPVGLTAGEKPTSFEVGGLRMMPNICFESTVPHLVRRQIAELTRSGQRPDVLINITDDGWFLGSSCLDLHLACSVFRAVENRRPMLVAANTGFSAWIDGNGRVLAKGPRRDTAVLLAEVRSDGRTSVYAWLGDWPALACLGFCLVMTLAGIWHWYLGRRNTNPSDSVHSASA